MAFWCAARLQAQHEQYALHCLAVAGYQSYYPRLRVRRARFGRKVEIHPPLFPGYAFVLIQLQWHTARWTLAGWIPSMINPRVPSGMG